MDRKKSLSIDIDDFISKFPYSDFKTPINSNQLIEKLKDFFGRESRYWTMDRESHYWDTQGPDRCTVKMKMSNPNSHPVFITLHFDKNSIVISAWGERTPFIPDIYIQDEPMQEEISLEELLPAVLSKLKAFFEKVINIEYTYRHKTPLLQ